MDLLIDRLLKISLCIIRCDHEFEEYVSTEPNNSTVREEKKRNEVDPTERVGYGGMVYEAGEEDEYAPLEIDILDEWGEPFTTTDLTEQVVREHLNQRVY